MRVCVCVGARRGVGGGGFAPSDSRPSACLFITTLNPPTSTHPATHPTLPPTPPTHPTHLPTHLPTHPPTYPPTHLPTHPPTSDPGYDWGAPWRCPLLVRLTALHLMKGPSAATPAPVLRDTAATE